MAIIGGGVVGIAAARALARADQDVLLLERHGRLGTETSSRNSGVIHAGLYYPTGSLKARACVEGRRLLYAFAEQAGVDHERTGKLVVATDDEELEALAALEARARANGVEDLTMRDARWLAREEPALRGVAALDVAVSGLIDAHELVGALSRSARDAGATLASGIEVRGLDAAQGGWVVTTADGAVRAQQVVNAAGLGADRIAELAGLDVEALGWRISPWKGSYFTLQNEAPRPNRALVYPMPVHGGLGVHLTRDRSGQTLAGPDAEPARDLADLDVDHRKAQAFAGSLARYLPGVRAQHLRPGYAGLRPKLHEDGSFADFVLEERPEGLFHLLGIESPGLTAALALAEMLGARMGTRVPH